MRSHSEESSTRGITSKGHGRSTGAVPSYVWNVIPMLRISRSAACWRSISPSIPMASR